MIRSFHIISAFSATLLFGLGAIAASSFEPTPDARPDILDRYFEASKTQTEKMRGLQMEMDVDAKLPKLNKQGKLHALRFVSKLGKITFNVLSFVGDNTIKKEVIARYLQAEQEANDKSDNMAITEKNYKFKHKKQVQLNSRVISIFEVTPREKRVGLFKGELWIDNETSMPVRESGRFVKNPSVFFKKVEFVREYEIKEGLSLPSAVKSFADVRIAGRVELDINFSHYTPRDAKLDIDDEAIASNTPSSPAQD